MHHASAALTVHGRRVICRRVLEEGWSVTAAATASGVSRQTASKWVNRFREAGDGGLANRSTKPRSSPYRLPTRHVARIVRARLRLRWGPHRLSWSLRYPRSTIYAVLRRLGISRRSQLEPRARIHRYEWPAPGDLVHLDTKKLGRIDGIGKRFGGPRRSRARGWNYVHVAIDDHSRLAYAEELPDELGSTATVFTMRAMAFFSSHGITVRRVLSDNGACYRSDVFRDTLAAAGIRTLRTRPYTPRTNGKAEAMVGVLLRGWAYRRPYSTSAERADALGTFLHTYNHHLPHGGLEGARPIDRVRQ
jgi:transposase InsO family protein